MPTKPLKTRVKELPAIYKVLGVGSFFGVVSVFMPWYVDVDKFNAGYNFYGINGPLYLLGGTLLLMFGASLSLVVAELLQKKISIPVKPYQFNIAVGAVSFYLIFLAYSIYFHPQFGLHIVNKEPRIGFVFALLASFLVGYGGYMQKKQSESSHGFESFTEHETVEKIVHPHREHQNMSDYGKSYVENVGERDVQDIPIRSEIIGSYQNSDNDNNLDYDN